MNNSESFNVWQRNRGPGFHVENRSCASNCESVRFVVGEERVYHASTLRAPCVHSEGSERKCNDSFALASVILLATVHLV